VWMISLRSSARALRALRHRCGACRAAASVSAELRELTRASKRARTLMQ
jgi:hypothetical protein